MKIVRLALGGSVQLGWKGSENILYIFLALTREYRRKIFKHVSFVFHYIFYNLYVWNDFKLSGT